VNIKITTLLGIFCKRSFTPAVTCCDKVHDAHIPTAALLCYLRCHWCQNLSEVNCILHWSPHPIHAADGHYTRSSSCITLLWLHHNHKVSVSYHKADLSVVTNPLANVLFFMCFIVRTFWRNCSWLSTAYLSLCQYGIGGWKWNHFAFMWIVFTFVELFSFMWGRHNCVRNMVFRFTCAVLWKLHG